MKFHLAAFDASQTAAALTNLAPLGDTVLTITNTNYLLVQEGISRIGALYAMGANITRAQLQVPSLVSIGYPEISPLDKAAAPSSLPPIYDLFDAPLEIQSDEQVSVAESQSSGIAEREIVLVWFVAGPADPVKGQIITLRFTNTDTLVANAWQNGQLTSAAGLRAGRYDVVGLRYEGANALAARLVFKDASAGIARPGTLGFSTVAKINSPRFRFGGLGVWGSFTSTTVPTVDFLALGADTSQTILLDCIYNPS